MQAYKDLMDKVMTRNGSSVGQCLRTWTKFWDKDENRGNTFLNDKYNGFLAPKNGCISGLAKTFLKISKVFQLQHIIVFILNYILLPVLKPTFPWYT